MFTNEGRPSFSVYDALDALNLAHLVAHTHSRRGVSNLPFHLGSSYFTCVLSVYRSFAACSRA